MSLKTWSWKWCGCILGVGNTQKGPDGLGQKTGSKVENSKNLESSLLHLMTICSFHTLGYRSNNFPLSLLNEYIQCFQNSHSS